LNVLEEVIPSTFELFIKKGNMLGSGLVKVFITDRLRLYLSEAVEVKLTCEGTELVMVEVLRYDNCRKLLLFKLGERMGYERIVYQRYMLCEQISKNNPPNHT
jgi:hypothetical protein